MIKQLLNSFITGIFGLLPITISLFVIYYIFGIFNKILSFFKDSNDPLLNIITFIITIIIIIFVGKKIQEKKQIAILSVTEMFLSKFVFIDTIISTIKDFSSMIQGKGKFESLGVARVPFAGGRTNGLITNVFEKENGTKEYTIFVVTGTFPPVGFVMYYDEQNVEIIKDMSAKDVFQLQITLGLNKN